MAQSWPWSTQIAVTKNIFTSFGYQTVRSQSVAITTSDGSSALSWVLSFILGGTHVREMSCCIQCKI